LSFPLVSGAELPWLTVDEMAEADRLAIEEFGIELLQMMEHAGSLLAEVVLAVAPSGPITVLAGGGNNGGGGLCAARHLHNRGREIEIVLATDRPGPAAAHHLHTLGEMGIRPVAEPTDRPVVVDALVGYGLQGALHGRAAELAATTGDRFVVSLDFPSGHGQSGGIDADATLTLALPKQGLRGLRPLFLGHLGLPRELWFRMGIEVGPIFAAGRIVQIV
jgi:NAD(P)H-hydrate epimerase